MPAGNIRDYGMASPHDLGEVSNPRVVKTINDKCPNCGCLTTYEINVDFESELLKEGKGIGVYLGCAACPWASPMITRSARS